jgi:hypothetical protein
MKYKILGRLGGSGPFIATVLQKMGLDAQYDPVNKPGDNDVAILVTYQYDMFAWVMTSRHVEDTLYQYNLGNRERFNAWIQHYVGPGDPQTLEEISMSDWAEHVVQSYKHIGMYAPLNGIFEDLELICEDSLCAKHDLPLELIVDKPEEAIRVIEKITEKTMDSNTKDFFLSELNKQKTLLSPWMEEYARAKEKSTDSYLWLKRLT